ncbi:MAG: ATPase with chaperone activity, ATP-binding subunit [Candidatus Daviesbacteria bacterium GW2011_GWA2_38_17]|nr:MAG: ATPase with chaperone activity, ATP-binding subunit [Candidatus Daviesbacteria bacterium GW2011_GWA2_38_17]
MESFDVFFRTWKNLILFLEEDLAVGLMWKLIFTPLFHDSSFIGRGLSIAFRMGRILIGLFAFACATALMIVICIYWLLLPMLAVADILQLLSRVLFLSGIGLFIIHVLTHPHKKIWQIKQSSDLWSASTIKKEDLSFKKLLLDPEVVNLLSNLELEVSHLPDLQIIDADKLEEKAFELAKTSGAVYITPYYFFVAQIQEIPNIDQFLLKMDLSLEDFSQALLYLEKKRQNWRSVFIWDDDFAVHHLKGVNRGWLGTPTPALDLVGSDLTKEAAKYGFPDLIRKSGVFEEITHILSQTTGRNVAVVGPPGSGKSALIKFLAQKIVVGDAPDALSTKRLVLLDFTKLLSGIKTQGDLAERIKNVFEEVEYAQNVIIVIEEIHNLGLGEAGTSFNLYSLMSPYLESDGFQFIATTETENYSRILEKQGSFARLFRKIELSPATEEETLEVLVDRAITVERKNKIKISLVALKEAVKLAQKLIHDRVLPDSAISVLKEAQTKAVNGWVTKNIVREVVSQFVKVPLSDLGTADKSKLLNLEAEIHGRLIDQEQAVKAVADTLRRSVTGLREENRPIGSFLFVGPTGVGKTELAKTLSDVYFKQEGAFIRFDMSEYQNPESVARLIGASGEGGQLTELVRNRPYALLLLDEFEKADPKILTLFLQVLEDGRLTDGAGRTVNFENTIIIVTSNAGSLSIAQGLSNGKNLEQIDKEVNEELLKVFKPELVNRFDEVVIFKPLSPEDLQKIVGIKLAGLQKQLKEKGFLVEFDDGLIAELGKQGFDPVLGARPLRRLIQDTLESKLSRLILENKLVKGQTFKAGAELL